MTTSNQESQLARFSTDLLPERDRLTGLREILGRKMSRLEFEPLTPAFHADVTLRIVGSLGLASIDHSLMRVSRTRELLVDGDDTLVFQIPAGGGVAAQLGREATMAPGDAVLASSADVGTFTCSSASGKSLLIGLARRELLPLVADFDTVLLTQVRRSAALQLLTGYLAVFADMPAMPGELQRAAVKHVYDLVAMALGATRDASEIARGGGVRAARLHAAKAFILHNLGSSDLMAATVAAHLGITPRYVHMLFQDEKESFSEFLLRERLMRAHRALIDDGVAGRPISAIAFDAGFSDLSYFNRTFRRRFGMTPSAARDEQLRKR